MALDITALDITVDETAGLQDDDTSASNSTVTYLLGLNAAPTLSATQVAFKADFITASATGNDSFSSVTLTQSIGGAAFSTTVGVNSNLRTVDGNYVWLFKDPNDSSVVIGVIGTSNPATAPNLGNPYTVAFALALVGGNTTTPDLYTAQYVPLLHPDTGNADDRIDLTNKVYASLSATTTVSFSGANAASGNPDFYIINSPTDATKQILVIGQAGGTANVSTQGFGIANQSINPTEILQVDFVTGGAPPSGSASQIAYTGHLEDVTRAGFTINQITPSSPDKRVDITITALNATGNAQGTDFYDGSPANAVDITSVKLTGASGNAATITVDGTYATPSGNVTITGLSGTGNVVTITGIDNVTVVDFTTAGPMDRLLVTGVDANEGCDITEFHFQTTTPNAHTEEVGSFINFDDDGPSVTATASTNFVQHDETQGVQNGGGDADDKDIAGSTVVFGTSTVASLFAGIISSGDPDVASKDTGNAIGYARSGGSLLNTPGGGYGSDGAGSLVYALSVAPGGVDSGVESTSGTKVFLYAGSGTTAGLILGRVGNESAGGDTPNASGAIAFALAVNPATGEAFIAQYLSLKHGNTASFDETINLLATSVQMSVTRTDGDGDSVSDSDNNVGDLFKFDDDGPTLSITTGVAVDSAAVNEASGAAGQSQATVTPPAFTASGADGVTSNTTYALSLAGTATGLQTTAGNFPITLVADSATQISGKYDSNGDTTLDATAFTVVLSGLNVTLTSLVALEHDNSQGGGEDNTLDLSGLINLVATVTVTDGDGDSTSSQSTTASALSLTFNDTDPTVTAPFDADPGTAGIQTPEHLGNAAGQTASGIFGYGMTDQIAGTAYNVATGVSDFVDADPNTAGVQIALTGTVSNAQNPGITQAVATLTAETATSATFDFSFHYDKDPITAGVQDSTAGGTLVFNKTLDTYTLTLTDVIDGFSFDVLHTNELVAKAPTGNTGHPLIVASQLTPNGDPDPFFVQFTGNSTTQQIGFGFNSSGDGAPVAGDTTFTGGVTHDMITNANEDWVSATQATNGVAGDTIQKGELLTLRFFDLNILGDVDPKAAGGGNERLVETATTSGVIIKFDGIGNSEDLVLILDLIDANGNEITRAVNVENSDLIKGNANIPAPYNGEFTLDNNDALLIIEQNDYTVAGETFQIQGVQIMQSANGLTGNAINLNGATGANGFSNATGSLTAWDPTDNDVLKIVDIGFVQQTSGTIGANLNFAFDIVDGDGDLLGVQNIPVQVSDLFIV